MLGDGRERPRLADLFQRVAPDGRSLSRGHAPSGTLDHLEGPPERRVGVEGGGVDHDRIGRGPQGGDRPRGIALVTAADVLQDGREVGRLVAGDELEVAPARSLLSSFSRVASEPASCLGPEQGRENEDACVRSELQVAADGAARATDREGRSFRRSLSKPAIIL